MTLLVLALAAAVLLAGILLAAVVLQEHTIRMLERTVEVQAAAEIREVQTAQLLREELLMLSQTARVLTLWRPKNVVPS